MSNKRSIFGPERRGIEVNGGRKANILNSLVKKTQLSFINLDKNQPTPFSAYSFSSAQSLSNSQVNQMGTNVTTQSIKNIVKEQMNKTMEQFLPFRDQEVLGLKKQIKLIRQNLEMLSKSTIKVIDQKANQLYSYFTDSMKQHQIITISNLKKFVDVMDKQIKQESSRSYVPISFLSDLEKQMQEYEQRIEQIQNRPLNTTIEKKQNQNLISKQVENNYNKIMRQLQSLKNKVTQISEEKSKLSTQVINLNKSLLELEFKSSNHESKFELITKKSAEEMSLELSKIRVQLQENTSKMIKGLQSKIKQKQIQQPPKIIEDNNTQFKKNVLQIDKRIQQNTNQQVLPPSNQIKSNSLLQNLQQIKRIQPEFKNINKVEQIVVKTQQITQKDTPINEKQQNSQLYQIDDEGYLLDGNGQFIVDSNGNYIILNQDQIKAIRLSQMIIQE